MEEKEFEKVNMFGKGNPNDAFAKYFVGNSYLNPLVDNTSPIFLANVTFEPGCRNNMHSRSWLVSRRRKRSSKFRARKSNSNSCKCKTLARRKKRQLVFTYCNRSTRRRYKK